MRIELPVSTSQRDRAHTEVIRALRNGVLVRPELCAQCNGDGNIAAHHNDYSKPLDVVWLCYSCHMLYHRHPEIRANACKDGLWSIEAGSVVSEMIQVRVTPDEKRALVDAARSDDLTLSSWGRIVMLDHLRLRGKPVQE